MGFRRFVTVLVAWVVIATPSIASACAVCSAGKDEENALAFLLSTIFMSLMPLAAIGTLVFVLWRRMQKLEAESADRDPRSAPSTPARRSNAALASDG